MATETSDVARWRPSHEEFWREGIRRMLPSLDLAMPLRHRLHAEASTWSASGVHITRMILSGVLTSGTRCVVADGADEVALHIVSNADISSPAHLGHEPVILNGEAVPTWNAEAHSMVWVAPTRATALRVSRKLLADVIPDLDDQLARPNLILRDNEALRLLITHVDSLLGSVLSKPDLQRLAASHVRDLVAATLGAARDTASLAKEGDIRAARLHAIKADITERLSNHDLSVTSVAARQQVTPRYVQTLFEREGTTLSAFVRAQRLARAYDLLADPRNANRPINIVAGEVGFSDRSHFNRTFRQRYGVAPSDVRTTARRKER
ncbi:helix-turn-helix transcriptional regulator [Bradyrhizobium sp. LHD-71]|uniref:helix-turn-helix transcriptional regulator n=1 Tax=Bradyrhizobium sp. LHD-71 TaxID=3072141 RepID=UPI00280F2388|nr:helix-turn-helix transcriptional regulator [Bradyrhizobium sp. LHD-71]MDQ8726479.1 helix-turn-helix transcriptional regulator [Bradyrhizobium sp. LHD-71]